jgi:phosphate transport system substrate-binding protein
MLKQIVFLACALNIGASFALEINGAGSTAAAPLYTEWKEAYAKKNTIQLSYQSIGSSAGIKKIKEKSVDFGASDAPMSVADLKKFNLLGFPTVISGVVPFVNLPGIKPGELRLTAELIVGIYSGKIVKWNDAAIVKENPKLALPNKAIVPLARADGSGTTYTLADYFSRISPEWKQQFGTDFTIAWPPAVITINGSNDLIATLKKSPGAIGYVEHAYVIENDLSYVQLKNRDGKYVKPDAGSFRAAVAQSGWQKSGNFEEMLTDQAGSGSWPITAGTYVFVPRVTSQPERTTAVLQFFTWAFMHGNGIADSMDYISLPDRVQARVFHEISSVADTQGRKLSIPISLN